MIGVGKGVGVVVGGNQIIVGVTVTVGSSGVLVGSGVWVDFVVHEVLTKITILLNKMNFNLRSLTAMNKSTHFLISG